MSRRADIDQANVGPDVDLDTEQVYLADGRRLTPALAEQLVDEVHQEMDRRAGRPSLTGEARTTPTLTVRLPGDVRNDLEAIATATGANLSQVAREALTEFAKTHRHAS